ncbi:MAG: glycerol-3-phosphate 1-O-acyltransferase PlsY [Pseudomonadota bacterium]|nr:glycerol-3-phosphate 1-O-acyltransferase PlsY [Pseudomonadota bacterium]
MSITIYFILSAVGGYLLGSIPFGLVLTRICGLGDIRKIGSGNIGATNVLRTGRKDLALLTVILDASKAGFAAWLAGYLAPQAYCSLFGFITTVAVVAGLIAGVMGVIGHNFPVWLKFRGGKGVASAFGFIVVTQWQLGVIALCVWLITAFTTRYSSLSAILAAVSVPFFAFFMSDPVHAAFYSAIALLVLIRHHANIARLIKGTESKISFKKKA